MTSNVPWSAKNPDGDLVPLLEAAIEDARRRHPSGKAAGMTIDPPALTAADRCDVACPAAAAYRMMRPDLAVNDDPDRSGCPTLDMCAHHWRENAPAMYEQGWVVVCGNPDELESS